MKITIAIPNFNGEKVLTENLPNILKINVNEILIIDDCSTDHSASLISEHFPQVRLLKNDVNLGFILTVNRLFQEAKGDIVVLLNNDVWVEKNFLKPLIANFNKDSVFAVNCHEEGEGWPKAEWKDGFFQWGRGTEGVKLHKSAWVSGGSAAYRKSIWNKLGGFDEIFAPGYWEDVDISYRAIKAGYDILWEPKSKVIHHHGTIMKKTFSSRYIQWIKDRNQLLFIWKNISDRQLLLEHQTYLFKRLFGEMGIGYWIPYLMALTKKPFISHNEYPNEKKDREAINYAND